MKLIIFVGGTCGSVNVQTFNDNLEELHVIESKRNAIRKGLVYELLNAQDMALGSSRADVIFNFFEACTRTTMRRISPP
jgi:hypothetical protein